MTPSPEGVDQKAKLTVAFASESKRSSWRCSTRSNNSTKRSAGPADAGWRSNRAMCGIAGIFAYAGESAPVDHGELLRIRERMHSRGPDGEGLWIAEDERIGLAHRRLAIIDLSDAGAQPMHDPETGNRIVFNGEIYNYQALRAELIAAGHLFRSHSDTEVLLKLYAAHGAEMLHKLRGMFAFAIWDEAKQGMLIARDPFGIKPLYLADDGSTLRLASQVKALLAGGAVDTAPEPAGHVGFFAWGSVPEPYTLYRGIRALPAGHSLWIERGGRQQQHAYLELNQVFAATDADAARIEYAEARQRLHDALLDSVRHHLVADVPVGVFLSAGLDSTTVAALASEAGVQELRTLTLGFNEFVGTENDEVPLAEAVARQFGATHQTRWVDREEFADQYRGLLDAMDQPSIDGVNSYFVAKAAHDAGLKVALSGLGGDELFAGYTHFETIPRMVHRLRPLAAIPGLGRGFRVVTAPMVGKITSPKFAGLLEYGGDHAGAYLLRRGLYMPWELPQVLDRDLAKQGWDELQTLAALRSTIAGVKGDREKVSLLDLGWYMRNQLLRDTDWASMAHSLEVRVPLVDLPLARTVADLSRAGLPADKQAMADAPRTKLPASVLNRKKTGFAVPVRDWLAQRSDQPPHGQARGLRGWALQLHRQQGAAVA